MIKTQAFKMFSQLEKQHTCIHAENVVYEVNPRDNKKQYNVTFNETEKAFNFSKEYVYNEVKIAISVVKEVKVKYVIINNISTRQETILPATVMIVVRRLNLPSYFYRHLGEVFLNEVVEGKSVEAIQALLSESLTQLQAVFDFCEEKNINDMKFIQKVVQKMKEMSFDNALQQAYENYVLNKTHWSKRTPPRYPVSLIGSRTLNERKYQEWKGKTIRSKFIWLNEVSYDFELCSETNRSNSGRLKYAKKLNNRVLRQKANQEIKNYLHGKGDDVTLTEHGIDFWNFD